MKLISILIISCMSVLLASTSRGDKPMTIVITHEQAKSMYDSMIGAEVENEGAAGHLYRVGKNIVCKYINVDMDDSKGNPIPNLDVKRYSCIIRIDQNGLALTPTG